MSLNQTPSGERVHIAFFGRRNAGKSSLVNAVTAQQISVVSDTKGTTTDPVTKAMELLPIGPVLIIDTPGFDDEGALGLLRVKRTKQVLNKTDIAVLVVDIVEGLKTCDNELIDLFKEKNIPFITVYNKSDLTDKSAGENNKTTVYTSAKTGFGIEDLKNTIGKLALQEKPVAPLVSDLVQPKDFVVMVIPIDSSAPKGRIILPQQQVLRELLDSGATAICVRDNELEETLENLGKKPSLVITDSQVFGKISKIVPQDINLTSFSILMARYKGFLKTAAVGATAIDSLENGDRVLISEGCSHHRQCEDIGTVKLPKWLKERTGKELIIETSSGTEFPEDLSKYALVIHCGGCMVTQREMVYRMKCSSDAGVPFTNYGIAIAHMHGILKRSVQVFSDIAPLI